MSLSILIQCFTSDVYSYVLYFQGCTIWLLNDNRISIMMTTVSLASLNVRGLDDSDKRRQIFHYFNTKTIILSTCKRPTVLLKLWKDMSF